MSMTSRDNVLNKIIQEGDQQYLLHPETNDKFVRTGRQIIEACQYDIDIKRWTDEVNRLLARVRAWAKERATSIRMVLLSARNGKLLLFIVPSAGSYDLDLADAIADLATEFFDDFRVVGYTEMIQIPESEIDRFVDMENCRGVYIGVQSSAHRPVVA